MTVTVIAPVAVTAEQNNSALETGVAATVATLSASGGAGGYEFSVVVDGITLEVARTTVTTTEETVMTVTGNITVSVDGDLTITSIARDIQTVLTTVDLETPTVVTMTREVLLSLVTVGSQTITATSANRLHYATITINTTPRYAALRYVRGALSHTESPTPGMQVPIYNYTVSVDLENDPLTLVTVETGSVTLYDANATVTIPVPLVERYVFYDEYLRNLDPPVAPAEADMSIVFTTTLGLPQSYVTVGSRVQTTISATLSRAVTFGGTAIMVTLNVERVSISTSFTNGGLSLQLVDGTVLVARGDNASTITVQFVAKEEDGDDGGDKVPPLTGGGATSDIVLTVLPPMSVAPVMLTVTTRFTAGVAGEPSGYFIQAFGGSPRVGGNTRYAYKYEGAALFSLSTAISFLQLQGGVEQIARATDDNLPILFWAGAAMQAEAGTVTATIIAEDFSVPPRAATAEVLAVHVHPPDVNVSVNQTVQRWKSGAMVTVATLAYSGGAKRTLSAIGANFVVTETTIDLLTATIAGVEGAGGFATVVGNEVLATANAAGEVKITVNAFDAEHEDAQNAATVITLDFVLPLAIDNVPSAPLVVTTQDNQPSEVTDGAALPRAIPASGGNTDGGAYQYNSLFTPLPPVPIGVQLPGYSYNKGTISQSGNTFPAIPFNARVFAIAKDGEVDGYSQSATVSITINYVNPPLVGVGFGGGEFNPTPLTSDSSIVIGTVTVGGGLRAQLPQIKDASDDFSFAEGTLLVLAGDNTQARTAKVTVSGNDENHTFTPEVLFSVTVTVAADVFLFGGRVTMFALAADEDANARFTASITVQGGVPPFVFTTLNTPAANYISATARASVVEFTRNSAGSGAAGDSAGFEYEVRDAVGNLATATLSVTVVSPLSANVITITSALTTNISQTIANLTAAGGISNYVFAGDYADAVLTDGTIVVASITAAATVTIEFTADDIEGDGNSENVPFTKPATASIVVTALNPMAIAGGVVEVTTKTRPGGAGGGGEAQVITTRVEFAYAIAGNFFVGAFNGSLRSNASLVITAVPGQPVTVTRNIGSDLQGAGTRNAQVIHTDNETDYPLTKNDVQIPNVAGNTYTLFPYPALSGGGGGGNVAALTLQASGGQAPYSYHLNGAQEAAALSDNILTYTEDSASNGVIYFNAGVAARAAPGDVAITDTLQARDASQPVRESGAAGLTVRYVLPPDVGLALNQRVRAYRTGASVAVAALTYSGGSSGGDVTATIAGRSSGAAVVVNDEVVVSADVTSTMTVTVNAFDAANDTAANDDKTVTIKFVSPLVIDDLPGAPLTVTTQDTHPDFPTPGFDLPRRMNVSGGNGNNRRDYDYTASENFSYDDIGDAILSYTGNNDKFAVSATVVEAEIVAHDRNIVDGYAQTATATVTVAFVDPPNVNIGFVDNAVNSPSPTSGTNITVGTLVVGGGLGAVQRAQIALAEGGQTDFEVINNTVLILKGDNTSARTATVTVFGNDAHTNTDAASLSVTVLIANEVRLLGGGRFTLLSQDAGLTLATIGLFGGVAPYSALTLISPQSLPAYIATAYLNTVSLEVRQTTGTTPAAGASHVLEFGIRELRSGGATATASVEITIIAPIRAEFAGVNGAVLTGNAATVATMRTSGGVGGYVYTDNNANVNLIDNTIVVANIPATGIVRYTVVVDDSEGGAAVGLTEPFTAAMLITAFGKVSAGINQSVRAYKTGERVTVAALIIGGGSPNGDLTSQLQSGNDSAVSVVNNEVVMSAGGGGDVLASIIAYDNNSALAGTATLTVTVNFVPPLVVADIPTSPLEVTTQDAHPDFIREGIALPRRMRASGGNGTYTYTAPANFSYSYDDIPALFGYTANRVGNNDFFAAAATNIVVSLFANDNEVNGYAQTATVIVTVRFVDPPALGIGFDGAANLVAQISTGDITIGTITIGGGLKPQNPVIAQNNSGFKFVNNSVLVLGGDNTEAREVSAVITADDLHSNTTPATLSVAVQVNDEISAEPIVVEVTTATNPGAVANTPAFTITPEGGIAPYQYRTKPDVDGFPPNANPTPLAPDNILRYNGDDILIFNNQIARNAAGTVEQSTEVWVIDSSPTRQRLTLMATIIYVLPPAAAINVNQTVQGGLVNTTVTAAELTYSGGSSGGDATATVAGVKDGAATIVNGELRVSANAAALAQATIVAFDADNATAPNATAIVSVGFFTPLIINTLPSAPLTVTTQDAQPSAPQAGAALPREMLASGGTSPYIYVVQPNTFGYAGGVLRYDANTFAATPQTVTISVIAGDTSSNGFSQIATATVTIAFVNPPPLGIGFAGAINNAARTVEGSVTIGVVTVGGGLNPQNAQVLGNNDFEFVNNSILVLGGDNTSARTITATVTGDDNHTGTTPASLSVTVMVDDTVPLAALPLAVTITTGSNPGAVANTPAATIMARGGVPPYQYIL